MSYEPVIHVQDLGKRYQRFANPRERLKQLIWKRRQHSEKEFWALQGATFDVMPGEVIGVIGRNGAGKSTLLQLISGTLTPTSGQVATTGRVAALLELGAGFNPEFTGRENIYLSAAIMGLSQVEVDALYDEIVAFAGIDEFIDQPLKTYSSGMYIRLAFAVATCVTPDILVIDEALSVGDGAFARKSFDRIMALKEVGKTILFCTHSMYQIDALCQRAIWLENGQVRMIGPAQEVTSAYNTSLATESVELMNPTLNLQESPGEQTRTESTGVAPATGRISLVIAEAGEQRGTKLQLKSLESSLSLSIEFFLDPSLPIPSVAFSIENAAGIMVSSVISNECDGSVTMDASGKGWAKVDFPNIPLLKGEYRVAVFLACERGIHVYDWAAQCVSLEVSQSGATQGMVVLPHAWRIND